MGTGMFEVFCSLFIVIGSLMVYFSHKEKADIVVKIVAYWIFIWAILGLVGAFLGVFN